MRMRATLAVATATWLMTANLAAGQSSSLYLQSPPAPVNRIDPEGRMDRLSSAISSASFTAVTLPEPRQFAVHDLVTIIVRESAESKSKASLDADRKSEYKGKIAAFPHLTLKNLLDLQLRGGSGENPPALDLKFDRKFESEGDYERRDSFITRLTARIIDIKPNGTLVLEARKFTQSDKETLEMVLTGTCRKQDVRPDNTVLSTELYDLYLVKKHSGEVRNTTRKGFLTKVMDAIFAF